MWDTSEIPAMKLSGPNPNPSRNTKVKGVLNRNSLNDFLEVDSHSRGTNSTHGDEAEVYPSQRLLQDSTGRLREFKIRSFPCQNTYLHMTDGFGSRYLRIL